MFSNFCIWKELVNVHALQKHHPSVRLTLILNHYCMKLEFPQSLLKECSQMIEDCLIVHHNLVRSQENLCAPRGIKMLLHPKIMSLNWMLEFTDILMEEFRLQVMCNVHDMSLLDMKVWNSTYLPLCRAENHE